MRRFVADYGRRALQAESRHGVDWDALSHAVRVAGRGQKSVECGRVTLPASDVERIRAIKLGLVRYGDVTEEIETLLSRVGEAAARSALPHEADRAWMDDFVAEVHGREVCGRAPRLRPGNIPKPPLHLGPTIPGYAPP